MTIVDWCRGTMCASKFRQAENETCNRSLRKWIFSRRDESRMGTEICLLLSRSKYIIHNATGKTPHSVI